MVHVHLDAECSIYNIAVKTDMYMNMLQESTIIAEYVRRQL